MSLAKDLIVLKSEFLARGQLPFARVAGETRQVIDVFSSSTNPVRSRYGPGALGALGAELPEEKKKRNLGPLDLEIISPVEETTMPSISCRSLDTSDLGFS